MAEDTHPVTKKRSWATFIPRPGSSSGRPSTSSGSFARPSSSGGWTSPPPPASSGFTVKRPGSSSGFKLKEIVVPILAPSPENGDPSVLSDSPKSSQSPKPFSTFVTVPTPSSSSSTPMSRSATYDAASPPTSPRRWSQNFLLTSFSKAASQAADNPISPPISANNGLERTVSQQPSIKSPDSTNKTGSSFGKSLSSMMGLSSLSLSRTSTRESTNEEKDRGRSMLKMKRIKSASQAPNPSDGPSRSVSRARSQSPFSFRRFINREPSPTPQPIHLSHSDAELSDTASSVLPRSTAFTDDDSGDEAGGTDFETDDADSSEEDTFDPITERNTERNALIPISPSDLAGAPPDVEDPDPVGEGVNVIIPPEPYFPTSLNSLGSASRGGKRNPRRRKSVKTHEPLPFNTSRPVFQRDRCTITITQGEPAARLGDRRKRHYVVASDLSEESRYAVEWGIGTVLRDGDEMLIVTVVENESKVDPPIPNAADRAAKLRGQQERQGLAYILVRQVTGLLQRTKLNVTISCQAWHAKNSRHMLLDIVDHVEPIMLIVGSRGLGQLNGILLGSTSHYLIQKCSVPVMVARRRLKRPPKKNAHLSTHRTHVSLAEAGIDRVAAKVDQDVKVMRDEIQKDDSRRDGGPGSRNDARFTVAEGDPGEEDDAEDDNDDEPTGVKVAG
ncbi:hypothetical protein CVT24_004905 [Panaeolus cyanescens]|uniref:UspA domain-containing protein n=1 Tax=Panaeolus cyanescens TaxID=181874 RepID=A0A409YB22_9AGAR|nr:hypothetical protein CVT24_004905 [Panaeolus cyanescens]